MRDAECCIVKNWGADRWGKLPKVRNLYVEMPVQKGKVRNYTTAHQYAGNKRQGTGVVLTIPRTVVGQRLD